MERASSTSSFRKNVPWGALAFAIVVFCVECFLGQPKWVMRAGRESSDHMVAGKALYVEKAPQADFIFLGDSTVTTQIDARYLTEEFARQGVPVTFLNLGLVGSTSFTGSSFLLARYLDHHPPPRQAMIMVSPYTMGELEVTFRMAGRLSRFFHKPDELVAEARLGVDSAARSLLHALFPSSLWNNMFESVPRRDLKNWRDLVARWERADSVYRSISENRGFSPVTENQELYQRDLSVELSPWNREAMVSLIQQLQEQGIKVYFSFPPVPHGPYLEFRRNEKAVASHEAFLKELQQMGVEHLPLPESLPDEWWGSLYHLTEANTHHYNRLVAKRLLEAWPASPLEHPGVHPEE